MDIEQLAAQNPWWASKESIKKDEKVKNVLNTEEKIQFHLAKSNLVLIGSRQLGKTTALKYDIYKKIIKENFDPKAIMYYSFDTSRNFEDISNVISTFVTDDSERILYLDEVSFVEGWQRAIKQFLDTPKSSHALLYITGSSSINLKKELMPGRKITFLEFKPLSFRQFITSFGSEDLKKFVENNHTSNLEKAIKIAKMALPYFEEIKKHFNTYVNTGGYPDAIFDYFKNSRTSESIYDIHWNAFVSDISKDNKSVKIATAVIYGVLESYSSKINLSSIARMQGVKSHVTVRDYLESFENLFVLKSIFPIAERKYVFRKERKVYFNDPFIYNLFAKKLNLFDKEKEFKIVEGIVCNHLYNTINKDKGISEPKTSIGYYSGKKEIDFIEGENAIEVKWQKNVNKSDFTHSNFKNKVLLSKNTIEFDGKVNASIIPTALFLAILS